MSDWLILYHQWFLELPLALRIIYGLIGIAGTAVLILATPSWMRWGRKKITRTGKKL